MLTAEIDYANTFHAARHKAGGSDQIRLNELGAPNSSVSFNNKRAILLGDPVDDTDATNKAWVLSQLGGGASPADIAYVDDYGDPTGIDDSGLLATAIAGALATHKILRLRPGITYRAQGLNPTGVVIDARDSTLKVPDGVTADNIFEPTGAWCLVGGILDGNSASTTAPSAYTSGGNGIYQYNAAGWAGLVKILGAPIFMNFWWHGIVGSTDITSLTDGALAPDAAIFVERAEMFDCESMGMRFTGMSGVSLFRPRIHDNGSHGIRTFLCKDIVATDVYSCDNPAGHGFTSLYCYDQEVSGKFNNNGTDGLVFGGDSTSLTNQPGRNIRVPHAECNGNGNMGLCFDATKTGLHDPVPVWAQVGIVHADGNTNEGVIVNSSQWVWIDQAFTDDNGGHGIQFASRNCGFGFHHAHGNAQKPLALQGNSTDPNWGEHWIGQRDYAGNTPDDTNTIGTVVAESVWTVTATSVDEPPSGLTLANMAPGMMFTVIYDGTNWTYDGATVTARPSDRTDLVMVCINSTDSTVPSWALDGDILWKL